MFMTFLDGSDIASFFIMVYGLFSTVSKFDT